MSEETYTSDPKSSIGIEVSATGKIARTVKLYWDPYSPVLMDQAANNDVVEEVFRLHRVIAAGIAAGRLED